MPGCMTCTLLAARDAGTRPLWDRIYRTAYWDVVHSYNTALPGWLVLVLRRHVEALADLTGPEALELGRLLRLTSQALHAATGCGKTYVMQFAESAEHPHVHVHVVPRTADMPEDRRGPQVFGYIGVPNEQRVPESAMNRIAEQVRGFLEAAY